MTIITRATAASIIEGLGGNLNSGMCCCPSHDDESPSLHVSDGPNGKPLLKCHGETKCTQEAVVNALKARGLWHRRGQPQWQVSTEDEEKNEAARKAKRFRKGMAILRAADRTREKAVAYLEGRGLTLVPDQAKLLPPPVIRRFTGKGFPAMVMPIIDGSGEPQAALVTFLNRDGTKNLRGLDKKSVRRIFGPSKGGYIQLGEPDRARPLLMGEGVETVLSAAQVTGLPAIATCGKVKMLGVTLPPCSELIIVADNDANGGGLKAAEEAAREQKQTRPDLGVRIAVPDGVKDWNDALRSGTSTVKLRRAILRAPLFEGSAPANADQEERQLTTRTIDQFEYRELEWLWWPFFPRGMVTLLYGDGEVGKSTIMCDVVARVTKGRPFPQFGDEPEEHAPKGSALILSQEEDISLIVRPRLEAAGANIKHVYTPGYEPAPGDANYFDLLDRLDTKANEIEALITKIGDVQLVSVDPITDYVGKIDMYRDDQVRTLLKPFARIAARHNLAFVIILHLNKKTDMAARYRGMGSIAFRNVARSSVLVANSVEQEGRRLMMLEKKNLTRYCYSVAFTTRNARGQPRIAWEREWIEANVDDVLNGKGPTKQKKAADLLREWLKDGPMSAIEIQELAQAQGISKRTLALAKAVVGAISVKNPDKTWSWKLPDAKGKQDDNGA